MKHLVTFIAATLLSLLTYATSKPAQSTLSSGNDITMPPEMADLSSIFQMAASQGQMDEEELIIQTPRVVMTSFEVHPKIDLTDFPKQSLLQTHGFNAMGTTSTTAKGGYTIKFVALANNIIGINKLNITSIMLGNKDISKQKDGKPGWEYNKMMSTIKDNYATFTITSPANIWGKGQPKVTGSVTLNIADKITDQTTTFSTDQKEVTIAGITFKISKEKSMWDDAEKLGITINGDTTKILSLDLSEGDTPLHSTGIISFGNKTTYSYDMPQSKEVTLSLTLATSISQKTLPIK